MAAHDDDAAGDVGPGSLYDGPDDESDDAPFGDDCADDAAAGMGWGRGLGCPAPGEGSGFWRAAVAHCAVPFAEVAAGLARLDERLRVMAQAVTAARRLPCALSRPLAVDQAAGDETWRTGPPRARPFGSTPRQGGWAGQGRFIQGFGRCHKQWTSR